MEILRAGFLSGCDQVRQLRRGVARGDPPALVAEQILPILKAHAGRAQAPPEGMFEIVHADAAKARRCDLTPYSVPVTNS